MDLIRTQTVERRTSIQNQSELPYLLLFVAFKKSTPWYPRSGLRPQFKTYSESTPIRFVPTMPFFFTTPTSHFRASKIPLECCREVHASFRFARLVGLRNVFSVERAMDQSGWGLKGVARGGREEALLATPKSAGQVPSLMFVCFW